MNILFDFDGTICDSLETIIEITNYFLRKLNKPIVTRKEVREKGAARLLKERGIPKYLLPFIVIFVRIRLAKIIPELRAFSDIYTVIEKLASKNKLGIVTSNSHKNVLTFLKNNKLEKYFDFVYTSVNYLDKSARIENAIKTYDINRSECFFVGDETRDIKSAKLTGIKTIAVTWGVESEKLIRLSKPSFLVRKPEELLKLF